MQALSLQTNGQLAGGPLYIPAAKAFDVATAAALPPDYQFGAQDLTAYIQQFWGQLN